MHKKIFDRLFLVLVLGMVLAVLCHPMIWRRKPAAQNSRTGVASWFSERSTQEERGEDKNSERRTANGEVYDDTKMVAASWDHDFNTVLTVENLKNGKTVRVRITDRGPCRRLYKEGRIIDLSRAAFAKIANLDEGLIDVRIEKARE